MLLCYAQFYESRLSRVEKPQGSVVNFGSEASMRGNVGQASYAAAKEAIRGLSRVSSQ